MRYFLLLAAILFSAYYADAQRREFHPTIDIGLNGGVDFARLGATKENNQKGKLKHFNVNLMSNMGFTRHIVEADLGSRLNGEQFVVSDTSGNKTIYDPKIFSLNYTFGYQLFDYFPACMIRNQVLLGLRINADILMGSYDAFYQNPANNSFYADDFGHYSVDLSLIADHNLNKQNYLMLQLYSPIFTVITKNDKLLVSNEESVALSDRLDNSTGWFFKNAEPGWPDSHTKLGIVATYRLLVSENFAVQVKYHGKLNSKTNYPALPKPPISSRLYQNHHQVMIGVAAHIKKMPFNF